MFALQSEQYLETLFQEYRFYDSRKDVFNVQCKGVWLLLMGCVMLYVYCVLRDDYFVLFNIREHCHRHTHTHKHIDNLDVAQPVSCIE